MLKAQHPDIYTTYSAYQYQNRVSSILDNYAKEEDAFTLFPFLAKEKDPFFLYFAIQSPHAAKYAEVPQSYRDMYPPNDPVIIVPPGTPFTVVNRQTVRNIVILNCLYNS